MIREYSSPPPLAETDLVCLNPLPKPDAWRRSRTLGSEPTFIEPLKNTITTRSNRSKLRSTWDPKTLESAALVPSFDRLQDSPSPKRTENEPIGSGKQLDNIKGKFKDDGGLNDHEEVAQPPVQSCDEDASDCKPPYRRKHRRNFAALQFRAVDTHDIEGGRNTPGPHEEAYIVPPEPVSHARQLRAKNSIPQLMKALPPLPAEVGGSSNPPGQELSDNIVATGLHARKAGSESSLSNDKGEHDQLTGSHPFGSSVAQGDLGTPKFKLRVHTSSPSSSKAKAACSSNGYESDHPSVFDSGVDAAGKPKLKLRVARRRQSKRRNGTVLRSPDLKQCNSLAELDHCSDKNMFASQCKLEQGFLTTPQSSSGRNRQGEEASPRSSKQFSIQDPPSPSSTEDQILCPRVSADKMVLREMRSVDSDAGPPEHRGLRQKMSMFRLRLAGTHKTATDSGTDAKTPLDDTKTAWSPRMAGNGRAMSRTNLVGPTGSGRRGGRVKKWAIDAKRAVRSCMRRTLDRSSREDE